MNTQTPVKSVDSLTLQVHSAFNTVQGEGPNSGLPATFLRLIGCNLQCVNCDTTYTSPEPYDCEPSHVETLINGITDAPLYNHLVITGGEPFRQGLALAMAVKTLLLHDKTRTIDIETNGTYSPSHVLSLLTEHERKRLFIVCSPKTRVVNSEMREHCDAWKFVISAAHIVRGDERAFLGWPTQVLGGQAGSKFNAAGESYFADNLLLRVIDQAKAGKPVYVHPEEIGGLGSPIYCANMTAALNLVKRYPTFRLGVQLHKYYELA